MRRRFLASIAGLSLLVLAGLATAGVAGAGAGCHGGTGVPSADSTAFVKIDGCTFLPTIDQVPVGASVTFLNSSKAPHDVTGRSGTWGSRMLEAGASFVHRFTAAGIYPYSCSLHPGMAGVVVVGPTDLALASNVQAPTAEATPAENGSAMPIAIAGGVGLLVGALGAGRLVRRREQAD